jgi:hypothetical protein
MPRLARIDSYVRILRDKGTLRRLILTSQKAVVADERYDGSRIWNYLESIFAQQTPIDYLVKPEPPAKAIVCLTGMRMGPRRPSGMDTQF